jgi:hypothetical protein
MRRSEGCVAYVGDSNPSYECLSSVGVGLEKTEGGDREDEENSERSDSSSAEARSRLSAHINQSIEKPKLD